MFPWKRSIWQNPNQKKKEIRELRLTSRLPCHIITYLFEVSSPN